MVLVEYSDSEGSGSEQALKIKYAQKTNSKGAKPAFRKVADQSKPNRIQISLPKRHDAGAEEEHEPASKRARNAGTFGGFNSFLPAPKKLTASTAAPRAKEDSTIPNRPVTRVNLKTGATPAFSRKVLPSNGEEDLSGTAALTPAPPQDEVKLVGKPMAFKPLSVSRKSKSKKPLGSAASAMVTMNAPSSGPPAAQPIVRSAESMHVSSSQALRKKKSLFFTDPDEPRDSPQGLGASEYTPVTLESEEPAENTLIPQYSEPITQRTAEPNNLSALATKLNLSASERRRLFGRNGPSDAQVAEFNLVTEYQSNRELAESGETAPAHNPVRSIAGGKHSLQQLINNATSQKDALEESFARGKGNKREAGSKYGW